MLSKLFYNIFLVLYAVGIRVASLWNPKAKKWVNGRNDILNKIATAMTDGVQKPVWMHCASLGEFEQGRPLLEDLRQNNPDRMIILTFFSPSGYEIMKGYTGADHIFYLPIDSPENATRFLDSVNPSIVLWVKYEYWYYYLQELKKRKIPVLLISGIFRDHQPFFKSYGSLWRAMLSCFTHFFVQNTESEQLLADIGIKENVTVTGDTRFDRVIEIEKNFAPVPHIEEFCNGQKVLVAGSTWEEDEIELLHFVKVHPQVKFIMAPHEITPENLRDVKQEFPNAVFYSELVANGNAAGRTENILIIDNIGMLSRLYRYAVITYVGGGFGEDGVHNVLEAAVYGKPVVFGPVYHKFHEAIGLVNAGGGISISGPLLLEEKLNTLMNDDEERKRRGEEARKYVYAHAGASQKIITYIQTNRLLTNA